MNLKSYCLIKIYLEEVFLFIQNSQMTLKESGTLVVVASKIQYICSLVCGKALRQIDTLYIEVGSTTLNNLKLIILGLGTYFSPVDKLSKKARDAPQND